MGLWELVVIGAITHSSVVNQIFTDLGFESADIAFALHTGFVIVIVNGRSAVLVVYIYCLCAAIGNERCPCSGGFRVQAVLGIMRARRDEIQRLG